MATKKKTAKRRETNVTIICEWCGEHKDVSRGDTKTCSPKCRTSLHRFVQMAGFPPDELPGERTPQQMFDLLVGMLLIREKARRDLERENNRRAAELLYGGGDRETPPRPFPPR